MEELEVLARHRPVVEPPDEAVREVAQQRLTALLRRSGRIRRHRQGPPKRRLQPLRTRATLAAGLALIAAVAAVAVVISIAGPAPEPSLDGLSAQEAIILVSQTAAQQDHPWIGGDYEGYLHFQRETTQLISVDGYSWYSKTVSKEWIAADGSGLTLVTVGEPEFPTEADRRAWEAGDGITLVDRNPPPLSREAGPGEMRAIADRLPPAGLPGDAGSLERLLRDRATADALSSPFMLSETEWMTRTIVEWLQLGLLSAEQRAGLFEVLAGVPELEVMGTIQDRSGRFGQGFSAEFPGGLRTVLIVDPETSHLLGTETIRYQPQTVPAGLHPEDAERIAEQLKHQPTDLPVTVAWDLYQLPELVDQLP